MINDNENEIIIHRSSFIIIVFPVDVAVACEHVEHSINVGIRVTETIVVNTITVDFIHNGRNDFFVYGLLDFMLALCANQGHDIVVEITLNLCQKVTVDALGRLKILVFGGFLAILQLLTVGIVVEFFAETTVSQLLFETDGIGQFCLIGLDVIPYLLQKQVFVELIPQRLVPMLQTMFTWNIWQIEMLLGMSGIRQYLVVAAADVVIAVHRGLVFSCKPGVGDGLAEVLYCDTTGDRGGKAEEDADEGFGLGGVERETGHFLHHGDYRASHLGG